MAFEIFTHKMIEEINFGDQREFHPLAIKINMFISNNLFINYGTKRV